MAITAKLSDGGNTRVVQTTIAGPQGIQGIQGTSGAAATFLNNMNDVNADAVADGSVLVYKSSTSKWVAKNDLAADSGTITVSGGNF
jgi:hypothetical protein